MSYYSNNTWEGILYCDYGHNDDAARYEAHLSTICITNVPKITLKNPIYGIIAFMRWLPMYVY